jgi:hypothetical protein
VMMTASTINTANTAPTGLIALGLVSLNTSTQSKNAKSPTLNSFLAIRDRQGLKVSGS